LGWFEIELGFLLWFGVVLAVTNDRKREREEKYSSWDMKMIKQEPKREHVNMLV